MRSPRRLAAMAAILISAPLVPRLDPILGPSVLLLGIAFNARCGGPIAGLVTAAVASPFVGMAVAAAQPTRATGVAPAAGLVLYLAAAALACLLAASCRREGRGRRDAERWGRLLVETAREGLWVIDPAGQTTYISPRMQEMLECPPHLMAGLRVGDFLYPEYRIQGLMEPSRWGDGPFQVSWLRLRRADGSRLKVNLSARPVRAEDGRVVGLAMMIEDVSPFEDAIADRDRALNALDAIESRHSRLVESNIIGVITATIEGEVIEANDAFLRLVGYSREELKGGLVRWSDLTPPECRRVDEERTQQLWASGACVPYEKAYIRRDGRRVPVLEGAAALERVPRRWVGFVLDLTERKRTEAMLKRAKEVAESASRAKDQFLAKLSHELRTPLTPVLAVASDLIDAPETPPALRPVLEMVRRNVELEARLIDDLLDLTRIRYGKMHLDLRATDAHALLRQTLEICGEEIRAGGLRVEVDLAASHPFVQADPTRLQQVFWNLIRNAIKFTPEGGLLGIRSSSRGREDADGVPGGEPWVLEVRDTGVGIDPEDLGRIFVAFEQGPRQAGPRPNGIGLGLAISRAVIEAHGGTLTATSPGKDRGTTFTIELGTAPAPREEAPERPPAEHEAPSEESPLTILLVDDNRDTLRYLSLLLTRRHHTVRSADSLAKALDVASEGDFDLLLSDIELPDGSGLELMRTLRASRRAPIAGIAFSGFGTPEDIERSRAVGFAEHLTKPIDFRVLSESIRRVAPAGKADLVRDPG